MGIADGFFWAIGERFISKGLFNLVQIFQSILLELESKVSFGITVFFGTIFQKIIIYL